jgi:hypothetical protein
LESAAGSTTWTSPRGKLWLRRLTRGADHPHLFDVINRNGRRVRQATLPARVRLVGLGRVWIYAVRQGPDGRESLQRYAFPR